MFLIAFTSSLEALFSNLNGSIIGEPVSPVSALKVASPNRKRLPYPFTRAKGLSDKIPAIRNSFYVLL